MHVLKYFFHTNTYIYVHVLLSLLSNLSSYMLSLKICVPLLLLMSCSESLGSPLSVALPLPLSSSEPVYHSSTLPSLTASSLGTGSSNPPSSSTTTSTTSSSVPSSSPFSTVGGSYDGTMPPHTRLAFSQNKEATGPVMVSGSSSHHVLNPGC